MGCKTYRKLKKYLYLLERKDDGFVGYDCYISAVVCALSEGNARLMHPDNGTINPDRAVYPNWDMETWVEHPDDVKVTLLGKAEDSIDIGVINSNNRGS